VAENLLCYLRVIDDRDDAHDSAAFRAAQRVFVPDFANDIAPLFGKQFGWRRWRDTGFGHNKFWQQAALPDAPRFVAVLPVVADPLDAFVRDGLGDGGDEIGGGIDLKVAVDFGVEARTISVF